MQTWAITSFSSILTWQWMAHLAARSLKSFMLLGTLVNRAKRTGLQHIDWKPLLLAWKQSVRACLFVIVRSSYKNSTT